jgi:hypothetical protein
MTSADPLSGTVDSAGVKSCPRCGTTKPRDQFYKNKKKPDGLEQYCKDCSKAYRKTVRNYDKAREQTREWMDANPDRVLAIHQTRERRIQENFVEDVDNIVLWKRGDGLCGICGRPIEDPDDTVVDHVVPISRGGEHSYANTQASHYDCNLRKGLA